MCKLAAKAPTTAATPHVATSLAAFLECGSKISNPYLLSHAFQPLLGVCQPNFFATAVVTPIVSRPQVNTAWVVSYIKPHTSINHPLHHRGYAVNHTPRVRTHRVIFNLEPQMLPPGVWYTPARSLTVLMQPAYHYVLLKTACFGCFLRASLKYVGRHAKQRKTCAVKGVGPSASNQDLVGWRYSPGMSWSRGGSAVSWHLWFSSPASGCCFVLWSIGRTPTGGRCFLVGGPDE